MSIFVDMLANEVLSMPEVRNDFFGRTILTVTPPAVLNAMSVGEILNDVKDAHKKNSQDIDYLYRFRCGEQPIISRVKVVRPEIKNIVVENRAAEIVDFKKGYEHSHPILYTNMSVSPDARAKGKGEGTPIDTLNAYARADSKDEKDQELADWIYTCGTSYKITLPNKIHTIDEAPYFTDVLDPRYTFVVYSNEVGKAALLSGKHIKRKVMGVAGIEEQTVYDIYTADKKYTWVFGAGDIDFTEVTPTETPHALGMIPIVEYPLNKMRLGYVELCMSLFNAINTIGSNRVDGIEQFIQSLLIFMNCELPDALDKDGKPIVDANGHRVKVVPKSGDAIDIKTNGPNAADVKYLIAKLDQSQAQVTKEDLLDAVYEICGVPSRNDRSGGGDTGRAVVLRDGWGAAESRAKSTEKMFRKSEVQYLKIVLRICRDTASSSEKIADLTMLDIGISFIRNRSDAMQTKAQTLKLLLDSGVNPPDAYENCEIFPDSGAVWARSKEFQDNDARYIEQKLKMARDLGNHGADNGTTMSNDISS